MCGICGFIAKRKITVEDLNRMNDTMYHRGPNDHGVEIFQGKDGYDIGMAQRRLSILDLSMLGHQPMHSADKRLTIVFNGEIYNFLELKEELKDYPFVSTCDTEVILAAYLKWGIEKLVEKINGMFAFALYDRETETTYLVRDRIGKKPLYYWYENEEIVYASELKPIMECPGFPKNLDQTVIRRYMQQQYINAPETIFQNVYKLEPGAVLEFHNGQIKTWKYWDIATVYQRESAKKAPSYEEAKEELKQILIDATRQRMIADVPLGTFLSGGYDSSLVTAIAQSLSDQPIKSFCIGFNEPKFNEAKYAKEVANHLGTDHTELYIDEKEMFDLVKDIPKYYDEPFADSSEIATMMVSMLAKQKVTCALSGDGGDEFFCGYNIYTNVGQAQKLDMLGGLTYGVCHMPPFKQMGIYNKLPFRVRVVANNRNPLTKTQISGDSYARAIAKMVRVEGLPGKYEIEDKYDVKDWKTKRMLLDMDTYLPGDILCKVDRASMRYSLESRCPILDTRVMEYSFRLPISYKFDKGNKKRILKDIAYDYIPKELLDRPKVGFGVPLDKWMRGPLKEQLVAYSRADYLKKQGIFVPDYVEKFIDKYLETGDMGPATGANFSKTAWSFFAFQQWYEAYMQ